MGFNDEEVKELLDILKGRIQGFAGDCEVSLGADSCEDALAKSELADTFSQCRSWASISLSLATNVLGRLTAQGVGEELEGQAKNRHVAGDEDRRDDGCVGDGGDTGVLPL